jgi:hypothetical protein
VAKEYSSDPSRALGTLRYAIEFYAAAKHVDRHLGMEEGYEKRAPTTVYFLLGHAIELALKSFLQHRGYSEKELINKFGHDLIKCMTKGIELGLRVSSVMVAMGPYSNYSMTSIQRRNSSTFLGALRTSRHLAYCRLCP